MKRGKTMTSRGYFKENHYQVTEVGRPGDTDNHAPKEKSLKLTVVCPFLGIKSELCSAALSSSMIDGGQCFDRAYEECAIFMVNKANGA